MDVNVVDHLLTTTRSVRLRLDFTRPVEPEIIERCIEIATQAPSGSNTQGWRFMVVTDPEKRAAIGELYKKSFHTYINSPDGPLVKKRTEDPYPSGQMTRVRNSSQYLADHMHEAPVLIICCIKGRPQSPIPFAQAGFYGSILPAAWSLMLALRARGLGAAWTTLHLRYEKEIAEVLNIPEDITQAVLLPVAYFKGEDFKAAKRLPAQACTYWNSWGEQ